jgi:hypothetical protein
MATQVSMFKSDSALPHLHVRGDVCPLCEQPIPHDRFEEIKARIESHASILETKFAEEKRKLEQEATRMAEQKITEARASAKREAEAAAKERLDVAELRRREAEEALERTKRENAEREAKIRADATRAAESNAQKKLRQQEEARLAAESKARAAEEQLRDRDQTFQLQLSDRLSEQRQAMDAERARIVNQLSAAAFKERQKLLQQMQSLERKLERKTNQELGEGAEVNLYDALKTEFPHDRIERVGPGHSGADIRHVVLNNGRECGTILFDSKNHGAWRNEFVTKLSADQMAERAEHAILSTCALPAGAQQVHQQGGVIIANPARVCALVHILRQHMVHVSTLKLSAESRDEKTEALYAFMTSERCSNFLNKFDEVAEELLQLQVKERKAHEATWQRQGVLYRTVQRTRADLCAQIDNIISESAS